MKVFSATSADFGVNAVLIVDHDHGHQHLIEVLCLNLTYSIRCLY
jgi:hypothetical protein